MEIMGERLGRLKEAIRGYDETGTSLIFFDGEIFRPAGITDHIGANYFIPLLARSFDLEAQEAATFFYYGIMWSSVIISFIGSCFLFRSWASRGLAFFGLLWLAKISIYSGDLYIVPPATIAALVPWFLYFSGKNKLTPAFLVCCFLSGVAIAFSNSIRIQGATGMIFFMGAAIVFFVQLPKKSKIQLISMVGVGLLVPYLFFSYLSHQRDAVLSQKIENYQTPPQRDVFWHSIYIGFGFLNNPMGIVYQDTFAEDKVHSISPSTAKRSPEYVQILKNEVLFLIRHRKNFVIYTVFAKIGVMLFFLLKFANIGLIAAYFYPKKRSLDFAFISALLYSSLFGVLVMPLAHYVLGFIAFSLFYGLISVNEAIERGALNKIKAGLPSWKTQN
jgi:hypothetical protein